MKDINKDWQYPFSDPNKDFLLEQFGDLLTADQIEELCTFIYLNGMIPHRTLEDMYYIQKGDTCLIIQRSSDNRLVIHKGVLTDQTTGYVEENICDTVWEITDSEGWQSYIWESVLPECAVFKCAYTW